MSTFAASEPISHGDNIEIYLHQLVDKTTTITLIDSSTEPEPLPFVKLKLCNSQVTILPDLTPMLKMIYDNPTKL